jgi:predicted nuclease of predicted toxin-antitoxin system
MKILIDENLPKRIKTILTEHEVFTVREKGWNGKSNGDLLEFMVTENFDIILTFDKNIEHQQNFIKFTIPVIVLNSEDNTFDTINKYSENIKKVLKTALKPGITKLFK